MLLQIAVPDLEPEIRWCLDRDPYRFWCSGVHHFDLYSPQQIRWTPTNWPASLARCRSTESHGRSGLHVRFIPTSAPVPNWHFRPHQPSTIHPRFFINKHPRLLHHRRLHLLRPTAIMHLLCMHRTLYLQRLQIHLRTISRSRQTGTIIRRSI